MASDRAPDTVHRPHGIDTVDAFTPKGFDELRAQMEPYWQQTQRIKNLLYEFDGLGSVLTTGVWGVGLRVDFDCYVIAATLLSREVGAMQVDVWRTDYAGFPGSVADSITGASPPVLSAAQKSKDTTLTGWSKKIGAGSILVPHIDSVSTITYAHLSLALKPT